MTAKRRVPHKLSQARAYWRLAAKADRQGNYKQGEFYRQIGDRAYRGYLREGGANDGTQRH